MSRESLCSPYLIPYAIFLSASANDSPCYYAALHTPSPSIMQSLSIWSLSGHFSMWWLQGDHKQMEREGERPHGIQCSPADYFSYLTSPLTPTPPSHKPLISILLYHSSSSYSFTSLFFLPLSFLPSHALSFFPCLCPSFYHSYIVLHALRHNNNSAWFLVCSLLDLWAWSYVKKY